MDGGKNKYRERQERIWRNRLKWREERNMEDKEKKEKKE